MVEGPFFSWSDLFNGLRRAELKNFKWLEIVSSKIPLTMQEQREEQGKMEEMQGEEEENEPERSSKECVETNEVQRVGEALSTDEKNRLLVYFKNRGCRSRYGLSCQYVLLSE